MPQSPCVLVTGGGKRIGAEICRHFHSQGFNILLHYGQSTADATQLAAELNKLRAHSVIVFPANLEAPSVDTLFTQAVNDSGWRLEALINNASLYRPMTWGEINSSDIQQMMASNLQAPLLICQALQKHLAINKGCIVNIIDSQIRYPDKNYAAYIAAKSALGGLTKAMAQDFAPLVRVNAVAPGAIFWPENSAELSVQEQQDMLEKIPLQRLGTAQEIAAACYFLTANATYITGQLIAVDGGKSLRAAL